MGATEAQAWDTASDNRDDGVAYRTLPHNDEAEQALLGAMLVNNEVANDYLALWKNILLER